MANGKNASLPKRLTLKRVLAGKILIRATSQAVRWILKISTIGPCMPTQRGLAHLDPSFGEKIFNISMTKVELIVKPDCVADDVRRKSVSLVCIHRPIVSQADLTWQYPLLLLR